MELVYYVAVSLDGYIATRDGGVKWLEAYEGGDEDYGYARFYSTVDALLMGRRTLDQSLGFGSWPWTDRPGVVVTHSVLPHSAPEAICAADSLPAAMDCLNNLKVKRAWLVGGGELAAECLRQGLITEIIVSVIPTLLGEGVPLFTGASGILELQVIDSQLYSSGVVQTRYLPS